MNNSPFVTKNENTINNYQINKNSILEIGNKSGISSNKTNDKDLSPKEGREK